ncbi:PepSY domain-containing protein [Planococcus salinus]|nr:PepSY domain-containing protein [Planococcus salinus]
MRKWMVVSVLMVLLAAVVLAILLFPDSAEQQVSRDEAKAVVTEMHGGTVSETVEKDGYFHVVFQRPDGQYRASVNKENGQVEELELLERKEPVKELTEQEAQSVAVNEVDGTVENIRYFEERNEYEVEIRREDQLTTIVLSAGTGEVKRITTNPAEAESEPEPDTVISREEAVAIARTVLAGEADSVEFQQTNDGGLYLVEIENDETDQEVLVQVHAIKGEILTVEWDS